MKTWRLIALAGSFFPLMAVQGATAQTQATQTPHQLTQDAADASPPLEDAEALPIAEATHKADGTSVQIAGVLEQKRGQDVYLLLDDSGQIDAIIPAAVLNNARIAPGDSVVVQGAIDKKQTPHRLRVSHFEKR